MIDNGGFQGNKFLFLNVMLKKRIIIPFAVGLILGIVLILSVISLNYSNGHGKITNMGFDEIRVSSQDGGSFEVLKVGQYAELPYGTYLIEIPSLNKTFPVFKNNKGNIVVEYYDGVLVFETDDNSSFNGP